MSYKERAALAKGTFIVRKYTEMTAAAGFTMFAEILRQIQRHTNLSTGLGMKASGVRTCLIIQQKLAHIKSPWRCCFVL